MPTPTAALVLQIAERDQGKDECRLRGATDWSVVLRSEKSGAIAALLLLLAVKRGWVG
jgi:hypothetical protein